MRTLRESLLEDRIDEIRQEVKLQSKRKARAEKELKRIDIRLGGLRKEWHEMDIELKYSLFKRGVL